MDDMLEHVKDYNRALKVVDDLKLKRGGGSSIRGAGQALKLPNMPQFY